MAKKKEGQERPKIKRFATILESTGRLMIMEYFKGEDGLWDIDGSVIYPTPEEYEQGLRAEATEAEQEEIEKYDRQVYEWNKHPRSKNVGRIIIA